MRDNRKRRARMTAPLLCTFVETLCTFMNMRTSEAPTADNRIEIELANGRRVRVGPGADMGALKRILDIADARQRP